MPFLTNIPTTTTILNHHLYPNLEKMGNFILWHKKQKKKQKLDCYRFPMLTCSKPYTHLRINKGDLYLLAQISHCIFGFRIFTYGRRPRKWTTFGFHSRCWARQNIRNAFAKYELNPIKTCHKAWPWRLKYQCELSLWDNRWESQQRLPMNKVPKCNFASRFADISCVWM